MTRRVAVLATLAVLGASCGSESGPVLTIGAGESAQSQVLAAVYAGALARTGARTAVRDGLGDRRAAIAALDADEVVAVGEVSGDLLTDLDSGSAARKPDAVTAALNAALPAGLIVGDAADGTDLRPVVVAAATRVAEFPPTLRDLGPRCAGLVVGVATGPALDPQRTPLDPHRDVVEPLRAVYGCELAEPVPFTDLGELRKALAEGRIGLGVLSGPPAYLPDGGRDLVALADPEYAFRAAMVLPLVRKGELNEIRLRKLNYVAGELTTGDLADLIRQVREDGVRPDEAARAWLDAHAL
ncbi:glycine betaine ABC transporter substrate-binding protein [Nocardia sp. NPDC003693]